MNVGRRASRSTSWLARPPLRRTPPRGSAGCTSWSTPIRHRHQHPRCGGAQAAFAQRRSRPPWRRSRGAAECGHEGRRAAGNSSGCRRNPVSLLMSRVPVAGSMMPTTMNSAALNGMGAQHRQAGERGVAAPAPNSSVIDRAGTRCRSQDQLQVVLADGAPAGHHRVPRPSTTTVGRHPGESANAGVIRAIGRRRP